MHGIFSICLSAGAGGGTERICGCVAGPKKVTEIDNIIFVSKILGFQMQIMDMHPRRRIRRLLLSDMVLAATWLGT